MSAPPLRLPGEHFAASLGFLVAGAFGVWRVAPELAAGAYPAASVVAVTHLFTLGWLTTSIMGALYQFLPVALNQAIASERLAHVTFVLHVTGVGLMVTGIALHHALTLGAGLAALSAGITLFVGNLAVTLRRSKQRELTWWALSAAVVFLSVALILGVALAINRFTGMLGSAQDLALRVHLHTAMYGWVLLVIVGVSHRLLPMFLLSHGGKERYGWWATGLITAGAALLALFHHVPVVGRELPIALLAAGLLVWVGQARVFYRHRHRPQLDAGLRLSAVAIVVLACAPLVLGRFLFPGASAAVRTLYAAILVLGAALFVAAQYYKIVPFLIWNRYYGPLAGSRPLPRVADLYAAREAMTAIALLAGGAVVALIGIAVASAGAVQASAVLLTSGAAVEARQLWGVSRRRP
ncbi:MAG: hypothetical protein H3C62_05090 [Gemmatimonadaceae bacterium]|nr:hypothetical protein [Gemmatimonadaceae bacterium]